MKAKFKQWVKSLLKSAMGSRLGRRVLDFIAMSRRSWLSAQVRASLMDKVFSAETVLNGPFQGMKYPYHHWCKLLGSYEDELHGVLEQICRTGYGQIINIGAAEGYFTVGLARRLPGAKVISYELDGALSRVGQEIAELNQVRPRITFRGGCRLADLQQTDYSRRTLIVCDCDTYELELLKPDKAPGLQQCDLLVETHDYMRAGITDELRRRFAGTHRLTVIKEQRKDAGRYPQISGLSPFEQEVCLFEDRISADTPWVMEWFFLEALPSPPAPHQNS